MIAVKLPYSISIGLSRIVYDISVQFLQDIALPTSDTPTKKQPSRRRVVLFSDCLFRLRDGNGDRDGGAHHRVVAHADETHHLDVRQETIFAIIFTYGAFAILKAFVLVCLFQTVLYCSILSRRGVEIVDRLSIFWSNFCYCGVAGDRYDSNEPQTITCVKKSIWHPSTKSKHQF